MKFLLMDNFASRVGGGEIHFSRLKNLLERKGHKVATYFSTDKPSLNTLGSIFSIKNLIKSYKKIKSFNADLVYINTYNLSLSLSPLLAAKLLKKKTLVVFQDFGLLCANGWCIDANGKPCKNPASIKWVFRRSINKKKFLNKLYDYVKNRIHLSLSGLFSDVCIGPSRQMVNYLKEIYGAEKVEHLPYFVDDSWKFRKKTKFHKRLLFVGRMEEEKGLEYLVRALKYLDKDFTLTVLSSGSQEGRLKELIKTDNIKNKVNFMGHVSNKNTQKYYHNADILVMPSIWMEQFGIVGLEAMACGTPVIASNIGGIPDWLKDGENGFLVPPRNTKKLAEAINKINDEILVRFARKGRELFENNFTSEAHYKGLLAILSRLGLVGGAK